MAVVPENETLTLVDARVTQPPTQPPLRLLIVDPHAPTRVAVALLLASEAGLKVRHAVGDLAAARRLLGDIDVALIESSLTPEPHFAVVRSQAPVVLMGVGDPRFYDQAAGVTGAVGYWPKDGDPSELCRLLAQAGRRTIAAETAGASVTRIDDRRRRRGRPTQRD